jgi:hypothetical protein
LAAVVKGGSAGVLESPDAMAERLWKEACSAPHDPTLDAVTSRERAIRARDANVREVLINEKAHPSWAPGFSEGYEFACRLFAEKLAPGAVSASRLAPEHVAALRDLLHDARELVEHPPILDPWDSTDRREKTAREAAALEAVLRLVGAYEEP